MASLEEVLWSEVVRENLKVLSLGFNDSVKYFIYPIKNIVSYISQKWY